jgi:hypothetical protein
MQKLPLPLIVEDMYEKWTMVMQLAAEGSSEMLQACLRNNWRHGSLPRAIGEAVVLCFCAVSTAVIYFEHNHRPLPPSLDIGFTLNAVAVLVQSSSSGLTDALVRTKNKVEEYKVQLQGVMASASLDIPIGATVAIPSLPGLNATGQADVDLSDLFMGSGADSWWNWPMDTVVDQFQWETGGSASGLYSYSHINFNILILCLLVLIALSMAE